MNKKLVAFLSVISLSLSLPLFPATAATKAGAKCTKVGIKSVVGNKTFTCVKSGKKLIWKGEISPTKTLSQDPIKIQLQNVVNSLAYDSYEIDVKVNFLVEKGNNGEYQELIEKGIFDSIKALKMISGFSPYKEIFVTIGRSQEWMKQQRTNYCLGYESIDDIIAADSIAPCPINLNTGLIEINLPGVATGRFLKADSNEDLSKLKVDKYTTQKIRNLAPHEYFHFWQHSISQRQVPSWFKEGSAQVFSIIVRAKQDGGADSYLSTFNNWFTQGDIAWSKQNCTDSISKVTYSMETQCQYIQGIYPVEVLIANFGLKSFVYLTELTRTLTFEKAFFQATNSDLDEFYKIVDDYTFSLGWRSGR